MLYPLAIGGACIITSIIGTYFVSSAQQRIMGAIYKGMIVAAVLSIPASSPSPTAWSAWAP